MKRNHIQLWRTVIALTLIFTLVFGTASTALAHTGGNKSEKETIKYVSLGDSMTNGFALPGYDNQGYKCYGTAAYPNQFAEWLEKETGKTVIHEQLAVSGTRIEDIHFLLDFPMKNGEPDPAAVAVAQKQAASWDESLANEWAATFDIGDWYTWSRLANHRWKTNCGGTGAVAKEYQRALAEADIISMATGNANFGSFATERISMVFSSEVDEAGIGNEWFDFNRAIAVCDPEIQDYFWELKADLESVVSSGVAALNLPLEKSQVDEMVNVLTYIGVSYVVHYAETMKDILEVNPDVEFVLMGIMDTVSSINISYEKEDGTVEIFSVMDLMRLLLQPVNAYIAALPAKMQETDNELYRQASFYYAKSPKVAVLSNEYENVVDDPESVARNRLVEGVVGGGSGIAWSALTPILNEQEVLKARNLELVPVTYEDVCAYNEKKYAGLSDSEIFSCAVYMAIENSIVKNSANAAVDINILLSLAEGIDKPLTYISNSIAEKNMEIFGEKGSVISNIEKTEAVLSDIFMKDETVNGLFQLLGSTAIANGLGGHPSVAGHDALSEAFIKAYKEGRTAADEINEIMDSIMAMMLKASPAMFDSQKQIIDKLKKAVNGLDRYAKSETDAFNAEIKPAYAGKGMDAELKNVEKQLNEMRKAIKAAKSAIGPLAEAVNAADTSKISDASGKVDQKMAAVDAKVVALNTSIVAAANKAIKIGLDNKAIKALAGEMYSYAALARVTTDIMKSDSREVTYAPSESSYYVALGDASATSKLATNAYGRKLVKELGLDHKTNFYNNGMSGMRADDLLYVLDESYEPDDYGKELFGSRIDRVRTDMIGKIEKADLITVGFSNTTLLDIAISQMIRTFAGKATYEIDWTRYLDENTAAQVEAMMADIETAMVEATAGMSGSGINMDNIGSAARAAIESYLYGYMGFFMNYQDAMNRIAEINPDAKIVLVGISNAFNGTNLIMGKDELPLGEYMGKLTDLMDLQQRSFAMMTGKAVYVEADDVEVSNSAYAGNMQIMNFISQLMIKGTDTLAASSNGHTYIKDQIMSVMNVVDVQTAAVMDQIAGLYDLLDLDLAQMNAAEKQIGAARSAYDELTADQKAAVDAELIRLLEFCETDFDYVKALAVETSSVTDLKAKLATKTKLTVSWKGVSGAQKYIVKIYRNGKLLKTVRTTAKSVSLTDIYRGCTYKATVQPAVTISGSEFAGTAKTAAVTSSLGKANLTIKKSGKNKLIKSADQNATGYQIWISKDRQFKKGVTKLTIVTNKAGLNRVIKAKNFKKGTNYVKVRAYTKFNSKTTYGKWSGTVKTVK